MAKIGQKTTELPVRLKILTDVKRGCKLQLQLLCCASPFYTAELSPNQICELAYHLHPLLSKNITFSRLLSPTTPPLFPTHFRRNKTMSFLLAIRYDLVIRSSQNDEEWYKNNTAQRCVLGLQLHVKGQGYINGSDAAWENKSDARNVHQEEVDAKKKCILLKQWL